MKRIFTCISVLILFSGCAALQTQKGPRGNFLEVLRLGLNVDKTFVVTALVKDFPAEVAGVKQGDIIVSVDGKHMAPGISFASLMANKKPGEYVSLAVSRNDVRMKFGIEPRVIKMRPTQVKINNLLYLEKKKIAMAVIVSEVKHSLKSVPEDWEASMRDNLISTYERDLLSAYGGSSGNFSTVDRTILKGILHEYPFYDEGSVPDELRKKISETTGATHLFEISFLRYRSLSKVLFDKVKVRLVDAESGKVLAVDRLKLPTGDDEGK